MEPEPIFDTFGLAYFFTAITSFAIAASLTVQTRAPIESHLS